MRQQMAAAPLKTLQLSDSIHMLYGPGGNMAALSGPDGHVLVDSSVAAQAPKILETMRGFANQPLRMLINTHWHFDHTDGNGALHEAGALIIAHENTRKRLSTPQEIKFMGMHFDPSPDSFLPQQTFRESEEIYFNKETLTLGHFTPAHTDTDIYIHYRNANVLHVGDLWFNGVYPLIDGSSGGNIGGMVTAADVALKLADSQTKIIPGHGALGDKAALAKYRDMLATVRDRVSKLKRQGKSLEEAIAAKPTADLDATWGKGGMNADQFVTLAYTTL
jgi:cyclase